MNEIHLFIGLVWKLFGGKASLEIFLPFIGTLDVDGGGEGTCYIFG